MSAAIASIPLLFLQINRRKTMTNFKIEKARCVTRTGWHGNAFVLPAETFGDAAGEEIILQSAIADGVTLTRAGTLADWRTRVAMPCAGNSRLVLALSAAFAASCLGMMNAEGGGIHFRGGSSSGKTTALLAAASVYGPATFMRTWRATDNALESVASLHSDMLLPLDEIGQLEPRAAGGAAYMLANGTGKTRSQRDGSTRAAARFRVLFLSAGEIGLGDLVREGGGKVRAGHEVRVMDIPAEPAGGTLGIFERMPEGVTPGQFAEQLKRATAEHHGHAFAEWLRYLTGNADTARTALRTKADELLKQLVLVDAAGQVRRVAQRFALIGAAGELATDQGLTGWKSGEAELAAYVCFRSWLKARALREARRTQVRRERLHPQRAHPRLGQQAARVRPQRPQIARRQQRRR
ncbi:MAG: DUF927 domain-containing protein [Rudaea sp.]|uniref:DUF927 domain-containing protein n=1 Tax=Rudaea sp. TaxID=2136325 RepID=UPI0039E3221A